MGSLVSMSPLRATERPGYEADETLPPGKIEYNRISTWRAPLRPIISAKVRQSVTQQRVHSAALLSEHRNPPQWSARANS